jgi:osmotically-inducible protein OsmY
MFEQTHATMAPVPLTLPLTHLPTGQVQKMTGFKATRLAGLLITSVVIATQLQGCFPVIVAGMAATTLAATDRRTLGAQTDDASIGIRTESRISARFGDAAHVTATSYNRKVLLTGEVPNQATKDESEKIAAGVENVLGVINELEISGTSSLTSRSSDALISTKVRANLINEKKLYANAFSIQTERGVVYLMGRVTQREGARAAELARNVGGVLKVVKVFDYITEDELKQMTAIQAPPDKK